MRSGGLIFQFIIGVRRLDRTNQALDTDPDFGGPRLGSDGKPIRHELPTVLIPCQLEPDHNHRQTSEGTLALEQRITFTVERKTLRRLGLLDEDGGSLTPLLGPNDRVEALFEKNMDLVQEFIDPPGLYIERVVPRGFGINVRRPRANLLALVCEERQLKPRRFS